MNREIENLFALYEKAKQARGDRPYTAPASEEHIQLARELNCNVESRVDHIGLLQAILEQVEVEARRVERAAKFLDDITARCENVSLAEAARARSAVNKRPKSS